MMCRHVFRLRRTQFQVLDAIVSGVTVFVVYAFATNELSAKMLLHDVSMLKNSRTVNVDSYIPQWSQARLPFFGVRPTGGDIVGAMSEHPSSMLWADSPVSFAEHERASFDCTRLSSCHACDSCVRFGIALTL
jgi:hypothetical protein